MGQVKQTDSEIEIINKLNSFCKYNPETGELIAIRKRHGKGVEIGKPLGCGNDYLHLHVNGELKQVHRLIWLLHTSKWPKYQIDHIDQNGLNNRIDNLRDVTATVNMQNRARQYNNKSGITGVHWNKREAKWYADITIGYKRIHLGYFFDKDLAIKARQTAEIKYNFNLING